ncbi:hypothetical protein KP509_23G025800 [Ceratopteris richardii]|nr:hypothetical protein KP509_23G025800 [Ceratopteris richardii]
MYVKFGMLEEAQEVFNQISIRDVVSWNTLIAGYTKQGESEKAIECFEQLQLEDLHPDSISFVCTLKACGSIGAIQKGIEIHNFILKRGLLQTDLAIGNALIDMYSKLGMLDNAQEVFEKMPSRDLISWNTMISGYVKHNYGQRALESYESMLHEGIFPDAITFVSILKASQNLRSIDNAFQVHREILQKGLELDILLSSTLLDTYAKCGWLADAKAVFLRLPFRDVVAWTSLIAGYAEHGYFIDALECFRQMLIEGITPDVVTFVCSLKACASLKALDQAKEIHSMIKARRLVTNPEVGNALVDMLAKCGLIVEAQKVFNQLTYLDSISWTSLIGAYAEAGQGEEALSCLDRMKAAGFTPNAVTYVFGLKACSTIGAVGKGQELHGDICGNKLLKTDLVVGNALVDMYFKCGLPGKGQDVFEKLVNRDVVSYNALITGYAQQGDVDNVEICFERMMEEGISPGLVTFVGILNVCSHVGLIYKGQKHFEAMIENFQVTPTLEHYTCMIDLFCHAGQLSKAIGMLLRMPIDTDVITMRSLLVACQNWANKEVNTHIFCQLLQLKELDSSSYISMLNTLAQSNRFGDN